MHVTSIPVRPDEITCHDPALSTRPSGRTVTVGSSRDRELDLAVPVDAPRDAAELAVRDAVAGPADRDRAGTTTRDRRRRRRAPARWRSRSLLRAVCVGAPSPRRCATCGCPTRNRQRASSAVRPVRLVWKPSISSIPPPAPRVVKIGTPASLSASTSRRIVRSETSSVSASSRAVHAPPPLQHQQHVEHPRGTHRESARRNLTVDVRFSVAGCSHDH